MLALRLGKTLPELLGSSTSSELLEWQAYFHLCDEAARGPSRPAPVAIPGKDGKPVESNAVKAGMQAMFGNRVKRKKQKRSSQ